MVAVLVGAVTALTLWASTPATARPDQVARGGTAFQANCAACHGTQAQGGVGTGTTRAPALVDVDIAYVDMTLRTGRMPIADPGVGVHNERLDDTTRAAVVAHLQQRLRLPGEIPEVGSGDPTRGQELYVRNCAACHGAAAGGGISGAEVRVPPLVEVDEVAVVEAARVGPFQMPALDAAVLNDDDPDDIVGYLDEVAATPRTVAGVREVEQVASGLYAVALGLAAGVVVLLVTYVRRWHPSEPGGFHATPPFEPRS